MEFLEARASLSAGQGGGEGEEPDGKRVDRGEHLEVCFAGVGWASCVSGGQVVEERKSHGLNSQEVAGRPSFEMGPWSDSNEEHHGATR